MLYFKYRHWVSSTIFSNIFLFQWFRMQMCGGFDGSYKIKSIGTFLIQFQCINILPMVYVGWNNYSLRLLTLAAAHDKSSIKPWFAGVFFSLSIISSILDAFQALMHVRRRPICCAACIHCREETTHLHLWIIPITFMNSTFVYRFLCLFVRVLVCNGTKL